jgi:hypothetical protein
MAIEISMLITRMACSESSYTPGYDSCRVYRIRRKGSVCTEWGSRAAHVGGYWKWKEACRRQGVKIRCKGNDRYYSSLVVVRYLRAQLCTASSTSDHQGAMRNSQCQNA